MLRGVPLCGGGALIAGLGGVRVTALALVGVVRETVIGLTGLARVDVVVRGGVCAHVFLIRGNCAPGADSEALRPSSPSP